MIPSLTFRIRPARSSTLIMGELSISGLGPNRIVYDATSGIPGYQKRGDMWVRGKGLIPPSDAIVTPYTVETMPIRPTNPASAGEWQYRILPDEIWSKTDPSSTRWAARRTLLRIHFDANHATSPGSAGCIVLTDAAQWDSFMENMARINLDSYGQTLLVIPLEVIHA